VSVTGNFLWALFYAVGGGEWLSLGVGVCKHI